MSEMSERVTFTRGPQRMNGVLWMCATIVLTPPLATWPFASAEAAVTQSFGNITPCNPETVAAKRRAGQIIDNIAGKRGEKGFQTGATITDVNGNTIAVYCLLANDKHSGPDQAALFTPKDKPGVWVGACTLLTGQNVFNLMVDKIYRSPDGGSFLGAVTGFKWENYENITAADKTRLETTDATSTAATYKDYEYSYDVATNKLTIDKTEGKSKKQEFARGTA